jgi:hypothetical protein
MKRKCKICGNRTKYEWCMACQRSCVKKFGPEPDADEPAEWAASRARKAERRREAWRRIGCK